MRILGTAALGDNEVRNGDNFHVIELHAVLWADTGAAHVEEDDIQRFVAPRGTAGLIQHKRLRHVQPLKIGCVIVVS